jgi:hypothetical protein
VRKSKENEPGFQFEINYFLRNHTSGEKMIWKEIQDTILLKSSGKIYCLEER